MEELIERINKVKQINLKELLRENSDFTFTEIEDQINRVIESIEGYLSFENYWKELPDSKRLNLLSTIDQFLELVERIKSFDPHQENPSAARTNLINDMKGQYQTFYDQIILPLDIQKAINLSSTERSREVVEQVENVLSSIKEKEGSAQKVLESLQKASATGGVANFANIFQDQADKYRRNAKYWLGVVVVFLIGGGLFLYNAILKLTNQISNQSDPYTILQLFLAKLIIFSLVIYVFYQIVKNYNASMNLAEVNQHRANSLKTFEAFINSTDDKQARDAVLLQATKTIFDHSETGYIGQKDHSPPDAFQIIERFRS